MSSGKVKKGFLSKQGGSSKGWKRRWCVFENNALFYYKQEGVRGLVGGGVTNARIAAPTGQGVCGRHLRRRHAQRLGQ